jgi:D-lyxose ketol-isomerase
MTELKFPLVITHLDPAKAGETYEGFASQETDAAEISGGQYGVHYLSAKGSIPEIPEHIHTNISEQVSVVLDGWCELEYEGAGLVRLERGTMVIAPPDMRHTFVRCSKDFVVVEMSSPAGINVVPVEAKP